MMPKVRNLEEIDRLADAILRYYEWRHNAAMVREKRKIKAMITRLRNRRLRQDAKGGLPD